MRLERRFQRFLLNMGFDGSVEGRQFGRYACGFTPACGSAVSSCGTGLIGTAEAVPLRGGLFGSTEAAPSRRFGWPGGVKRVGMVC